MNVYIPEDRKEIVGQADAMVALQEALQNEEYSCGDGTLDGCGDFCLDQSTGADAIPQVCRNIAQRFFGPEGVAELERAHKQVGSAVDYYQDRVDYIDFETLDGTKLYRPEEIGRYLEEQGRRGDVEAVDKGMDFLVARGFISPEDKRFALEMVQGFRDEGIPDFDACREDPRNCSDFIPEDYRQTFGVMEKIHNIMLLEMNREGIPNPSLCEDPKYGEGCFRAVQRVLRN